jgi:hypothetical protein
MLSARISRLSQSTAFTKRLLATLAAQDGNAFRIPVIDFSKFRKATALSQSEKKTTANSVVSAFKQSGFVYLSGHGIPSSMLFSILSCSPSNC